MAGQAPLSLRLLAGKFWTSLGPGAWNILLGDSQVQLWEWLGFESHPGEERAQASGNAKGGSSPDSEKTGYRGQPGGCCVR